MSSAKLGKVQLEIMRVLWQHPRATAREITDELNREPREARIAHSTVQTLLRQMEAKGAVTHQQVNRTFVFSAAHEQTEVTSTATRDLVSRLFGGSVSGLVAHLLKHEKISPQELERLRQLIEEAKP